MQVYASSSSVKVTNGSVRMKNSCHVSRATRARPPCFLQIRGGCNMLPPLTKLREFWSLSWPTVMVHKHAFCHDWQLISAGRLVRDLASGCSWVTASPAAPAQEPCSPVSFVLTLCSMCKLYRQHRDHWSRSWSYQGKADFFPSLCKQI